MKKHCLGWTCLCPRHEYASCVGTQVSSTQGCGWSWTGSSVSTISSCSHTVSQSFILLTLSNCELEHIFYCCCCFSSVVRLDDSHWIDHVFYSRPPILSWEWPEQWAGLDAGLLRDDLSSNLIPVWQWFSGVFRRLVQLGTVQILCGS